MSFTGDFVDASTALAWGLVVEVVPHEDLLARARELAAAVVSIPPANVQEVRRMYEDVSALAGPDAWRAEAAWARQWMADRFDQSRLAGERERIMARGRDQAGSETQTDGDAPA
jgi:enoyl-CoA hydratase